MRPWSILGALATSLLAACGAGESTDGGTGASGPTPMPSAQPDPPEQEAGTYVGPGCDVKTDGPREASVLVSVPRAQGGAAWETPENARKPDEAFARAALTDHAETDELRLSGFGFQLPEGARVTGYEVQLVRRAPDGGVVDGQIKLVNDQRASRFKYISTPWPSSIVGTHHYGQPIDTWDFELSPAEVNAASFGVTFYAKRDQGAAAGATAIVDSIRVKVGYCL